MNSIVFLKAAYAVAWIIYLGYLGRILLRMKKVEREREELERTTRSEADRVATLTRSAS
jgi:hypothetical protein